MKFELNETEHKLLRDILNDVMRQEGTGGAEYEETLNALHEKICLYWIDEADKSSYKSSYVEKLEEQARFWGGVLNPGLID